jgi:hypothetical protein
MKRSSWEKREVFIAVAIGLRIRNVSVCFVKNRECSSCKGGVCV